MKCPDVTKPCKSKIYWWFYSAIRRRTQKRIFILAFIYFCFIFYERLFYLHRELFQENRFLSDDKSILSLNSEIRQWGCYLTETPVIFVHIGKAGGGSTRARFAAAAENYTRHRQRWRVPDLDHHFYPIRGNTTEKAKFCNSNNKVHRIEREDKDYKYCIYEGVAPCSAATPLGMMIACPEVLRNPCQGCEPNSDQCHTVYVGHNMMGSEIHWLPPKILQNWWKQHATTLFSDLDFDERILSIQNALYSLNPGNRSWCKTLQIARPFDNRDRIANNGTLKHTCSSPLGTRIDHNFNHMWIYRSLKKQANLKDFSPFYASLPVHRTVVIRDPFSWLLSKYFWHNCEVEACDNILSPCYNNSGDVWSNQFITEYIGYLCGVDCIPRFEYGLMTTEEMIIQAEGNLRRSFSVVGMIEEIDQFYGMVSTRFDYLDMSLNPHISGASHSTRNGMKHESEIVEYDRCKEKFSDETFRQYFRDQIPELVGLERLYQVGIEVNRFQMDELKRCNSSLSISL